MAVYSWSRPNVASVANGAGGVDFYCEMQADIGFSAQVQEIMLCTAGAGNNPIGLERATVNGVITGRERGQIESEYDDYAPGALRADGVWFGYRWSQVPVTPSFFIRRGVLGGTGFVYVWSFPRGLRVVGGGQSLCVTGGGNIPAHISVTYEA